MLHHIQEARLHLNCVRKALQSPGPEPLELGIQELELAVESLAQAIKEAGTAFRKDARLRSEITSLRTELDAVVKLAEQERQFQAGWAAMLAQALGGYTAQGESTAFAAQGQICVEG